MTTLVVEELKTTLSQNFTINGERRYQLVAVRPKIYMHNAPNGTFSLSIKSGSTTLASKSFTSAEIKSDLSTSDNYAWIWKNLAFDFTVPLEKGDYSLELSSSGYSFSSSSYIGWVKDHESVFNTISGNPTSSLDNPFTFQLFEYRTRESFL